MWQTVALLADDRKWDNKGLNTYNRVDIEMQYRGNVC